MSLIPVIGLEIHAELLTKTKIFCSCANKFGEKSNTLVCPICSGMPGTLPMLNKEAFLLAVKAGLVLDCKINSKSSFDRKNYFYPDLPKGYQITQYYHPLCENGYIDINNKRFNIERIHIEEDAGKLIHEKRSTLIDLNRCGVPLIEIVTKPDFNSAEEVCLFIREISSRLKYADVCDARLEEGSLRVDVNISAKDENSSILGTRTEIKNLNSLKSVAKAIEYEFNRQCLILSKGEEIICETRRYNENSAKTESMRIKEKPSDYRYFPEPDIPAICISDDEINNAKKLLPKMPKERIEEYKELYGISEQDAVLLTNDKAISDFFEAVISEYRSPKTITKIILGYIFRNMNELKLKKIPLLPKNVANCAKLLDDKKITGNALSEIVALMFKNNDPPIEIAKKNNFLIKDNKEEIEKIVSEVLSKNRKAVNEYNSGKKKAFAFLMGQVIRNCEKGTNPKSVTKILENNLSTFSDNS